MKTIYIRITAINKFDEFENLFISTLHNSFGSKGKVYIEAHEKTRNVADWLPVKEVIIALGSAGLFTTLYQVISSYLSRDKDKELSIEIEGAKITIKGHNLPQEQELLKLIYKNKENDNIETKGNKPIDP